MGGEEAEAAITALQRDGSIQDGSPSVNPLQKALTDTLKDLTKALGVS